MAKWCKSCKDMNYISFPNGDAPITNMEGFDGATLEKAGEGKKKSNSQIPGIPVRGKSRDVGKKSGRSKKSKSDQKLRFQEICFGGDFCLQYNISR